MLENNINKLSNEELEFRQFKLSNKTERCKRIDRNKAEFVKRYAKRAFRKWKKKLLSQKGKGNRNFRIDQLAEDVIFKTLCEKMKAHHRRKGDMDTGYLDLYDKRLYSKNLLLIANNG